jgi:hypothetical protein
MVVSLKNFLGLIQGSISLYLLFKIQSLNSSLTILNAQFKANALVLKNQAGLLAEIASSKVPSKSMPVTIEASTSDSHGFVLDFLLLHGDRLILLSGAFMLLSLGWYFFPSVWGSGFGALLVATDNAAGAAGAALNSTVGALQRGAVALTSSSTTTSGAGTSGLKEEILLNLLDLPADLGQRLILHSESPDGGGGTIASFLLKEVNPETIYSLPAVVAPTAEELQWIAELASTC